MIAMSRQCSLASPTVTACEDLSLLSLCPFLGNPCDSTLVMNQVSRPLYITTKLIIMIDFVLVMVLISK
jgi:hypothetical protein